MALLLVMGANKAHSDPLKDQRGSYKRGDIVDVYEDDRHDGDLVRNPIAPPFVLIRVNGVTAAQVRAYIEPQVTERIDPDQGFVREVVRRRLFRLRVDDLPLTVRQALVRDRYYETNAATVRRFIRNKVTNQDVG